LIKDSNGNLFGTTVNGGAHGYGGVFELAADNTSSTGYSSTVTDLADFDFSTTGAYPFGTLVEDSNGNFFGTADSGGANSFGTLLDPNDIDTKLSLPDVEGLDAVRFQQASFVGAPVKDRAFKPSDASGQGILLGVINVMLPIDGPGFNHIDPDVYMARAYLKDNAWTIRLISPKNQIIEVPAVATQVRGVAQPEPPLALILNWCWGRYDTNWWCMWERPDR